MDEREPARSHLHLQRRRPLLEAVGVLHPGQHDQVPEDTRRGDRQGEGGDPQEQGQAQRGRPRQGKGFRWEGEGRWQGRAPEQEEQGAEAGVGAIKTDLFKLDTFLFVTIMITLENTCFRV